MKTRQCLAPLGLLVTFSTFWALMGASCGGGTDPNSAITIKGRLSFADPMGCTSPVQEQSVSWKDCHAFKRQFDPGTGALITSDTSQDNALRPLPASVYVELFKWDGVPGSVGIKCGEITTPLLTDVNGYFQVSVTKCNTTGTINVRVRPQLAYQIEDVPFSEGAPTIRALWRREDFDSFSPYSTLDTDPVAFSQVEQVDDPANPGTKINKTFQYAYPTFEFTQAISGGDAALSEMDLGNAVILGGLDASSFHYPLHVMSAWATMVELNRKIIGYYNSIGKASDALKLYVDDSARDCTGLCYSVFFNNTWAFGGGGSISIYQYKGASDKTARLLSSTEVLSHEFGHSIHAQFAGSTFQHDYSFGNKLRRSDNTEYDWGHGGNQLQEMGTSFTEGLASTLGQYMLNGCGNADPTRRFGGIPDPWDKNLMYPDTSCDATDGCPMHHVRWNLANRGVTEGSSDWTTRVDALKSLGDQAVSVGHHYVITNNEMRYASFGCDLLDADTNVSQANGVSGKKYIDNYTSLVGQIYNGVNVTPNVRTYLGDPAPETIQISFTDLLDAMGGVCADGSCAWPSTFKPEYPASRLDTRAGVSAQRLGKYLVSKGKTDLPQLNNLLKSLLMEETL